MRAGDAEDQGVRPEVTRTKITVEIEYLSQDARDAAMQPGFEEGFAASYKHLDKLLPKIAD